MNENPKPYSSTKSPRIIKQDLYSNLILNGGIWISVAKLAEGKLKLNFSPQRSWKGNAHEKPNENRTIIIYNPVVFKQSFAWFYCAFIDFWFTKQLITVNENIELSTSLLDLFRKHVSWCTILWEIKFRWTESNMSVTFTFFSPLVGLSRFQLSDRATN